MPQLTEADERRVADAIAEAETRCGAEILCVVARAADDYLYIPTLAAALIALGGAALWASVDSRVDAASLVIVQTCAFFGFAAAFRWPPLTRRLIPAAVRTRRARRLAREAFFAEGLHLTPDRVGLLLFIAFAERHVEILADSGVEAAIDGDDALWAGIIDHIRPRLRAGALGDALVQAVGEMADILAEKLPPRPDRPNALPDKLIVL